jgi:hypothetical protein
MDPGEEVTRPGRLDFIHTSQDFDQIAKTSFSGKLSLRSRKVSAAELTF